MIRFPGFQHSTDAAKAVAKLLRSSFWLPTLSPKTAYRRLQDDHDGKRWGILTVVFSEDSDAWLEIDLNGVEVLDTTIRFRVPVVGGGRSPRTRTALHILAEAIRLDNEESPQDLSPHPSVGASPAAIRGRPCTHRFTLDCCRLIRPDDKCDGCGMTYEETTRRPVPRAIDKARASVTKSDARQTSKPKLYAERDIIEQMQVYVDHVEAMTAEGLHSKSDIAAELAHRDIQIQRLQHTNTQLHNEIASLNHDLSDWRNECARRQSEPPARSFDQLHDMLHTDQTGLVAGLEAVLNTVAGFRWTTESRGCYEWDDARFHGEMKNMLDAVQKEAQSAVDRWKLWKRPCCQLPRADLLAEAVKLIDEARSFPDDIVGVVDEKIEAFKKKCLSTSSRSRTAELLAALEWIKERSAECSGYLCWDSRNERFIEVGYPSEYSTASAPESVIAVMKLISTSSMQATREDQPCPLEKNGHHDFRHEVCDCGASRGDTEGERT
jgi:hypothetical protein